MEDQSREGINLTKFIQLFRLLLPKNTRTLAVLGKFSDLDLPLIKKLTGIDIKGIILDVDGCIAKNHGKIKEENLRHIKRLVSRGIRIAIVSNMKKSARYDALPGKVHVLTNFKPKPAAEGFLKAVKKMGLKKKNIVMVGDNYITDGGSIRWGIPFVRVKPIRHKGESIAEKGHSFIRGFFILVSKIYDFRRKNPISTKDIKLAR